MKTLETFNPLNATPHDVIHRSIALHPSLFADYMRRSADTHNAAAREMGHWQAVAAAQDLANACRKTAQLIENDNIGAIMSEMRLWIPALHNACKLQCISGFERDIVTRHESAA